MKNNCAESILDEPFGGGSMTITHVAIAGMVAALIGACGPATHPSSSDLAELRTIEEAIYAPYLDQDLNTGDEDAAPWSNAVRERMAEVSAISERTEAPLFAFNPLTESQEDIISDLNVGEPSMSAEGVATVEVRFTLGDERVQQHEFIREGGAWRLNNIRTPDWDLDTTLRRAIEDGHAYERCIERGGGHECEDLIRSD